MVSQKSFITITRTGDRYFYCRHVKGATPFEGYVDRGRAKTIIDNKPNGEVTNGELSFDEGVARYWTWIVTGKLFCDTI